MFQRLLCFLCCALLALTPVAAVAEGAFTMAGYDGEDSTHDWATNAFFTRMEARTGLTFTFQQYDKLADWQKAKAAMYEGGELPDVFFKAAFSTDELIRWTDSGKLIDLKPLLAQNAPNLWQLLTEHPEWMEAITLPNGKIGALPAIQTVTPQNAMWINAEWLEELKLNMPTDFESLRAVLTAFRDRDPNGNGKKDEIPMLFLGPWELKFFSHAYGVVANDYNIYLDESGKVHYWPDEDSFFQLAGELRTLFEEKLLDPNGFTTVDALRRVTDSEADAVYGSMFSPTPVNLLPYDTAMAYVLLEPFYYEGRQVYRDLFGEITRGTFAITSACEDPAAVLAWVDYLYTEEGFILAEAGVDGEEFTWNDDGTWLWESTSESLLSTILPEATIRSGTNMPVHASLPFQQKIDDASTKQVVASLIALKAIDSMPYPLVYLTEEQQTRVAELIWDIGKYAEYQMVWFIAGDVAFNDDTWQDFCEQVKALGMDEMVSIWQTAADHQQ